MKRTSLVLDEALLDKAREVLGAKTFSETVNSALKEVIRISQIRGFTKWFGSRIYEGSLPERRQKGSRNP